MTQATSPPNGDGEPMPDRRCGTCRSSLLMTPTSLIVGQPEVLECHHQPPVPFLVPQQGLGGTVSMALNSYFPLVRAQNWCRQYEPKGSHDHLYAFDLFG